MSNEITTERTSKSIGIMVSMVKSRIKKSNKCFTATPIDWHRHRRKKIHGQTKNRKRIPTRH